MAKISKKKPLGRGLSSLLGDNINVDNLTYQNKKNNFSVLYQLITCQQDRGRSEKCLMKVNYIAFHNL